MARPSPLVSLLLASCLLVPAARAACPGDCSVPGGGSTTTDCIVEYDGVTYNYPGPTKLKELRCVDGDPTCDTDGAANGVCRFEISVCLDNTDSRFPGCTPSDVASYAIKNKPLGGPKHDAQLQAMQDAVAAMLPTSSAECTGPHTVTVPLKTSGINFKKSKKKIKSTALTSTGAKDTDKVQLTCLPSTVFPGPGFTYALAKEITAPAELIEGPMARGTLGDFLLANEHIQVVIQKPGRVMFGIGTYGGNIIDADLQRSTGADERDSFEEWAPGINIENTANYTNVTVLNDGSNGMPAVIRATGPDDLLDFINPSSVVAGFGFVFPASADDRDLPVDVQTDYTLEAGKRYVKVETTLTNTGLLPLDIYFAEYLNGSGQLETFQPVYGFGEPLLTDPQCGANKPCAAGMCDLCDFVAYSGYDGADGVSYGYIDAIDGTTTFSTSGVTVPLLGQRALLAVIGAAAPNFHLNASGSPGDAITLTRYFAVGDGSVASIEDVRNEIRGVSNLGTLRGVVSSGGFPVANADVAVLGTVISGGPSKNVVDHFKTAADGTYVGSLPAGSYTVRANQDGRLFGTPDPANVTITAGNTTTQDFTLPGPGHLRVTVTDENDAPIPAKVQLVGFDPSPDPLNTQSIAGLVNNTTGVFGELLVDAPQYGIPLVRFADRTGDTGIVDAEPGSYYLAVSHGLRYSASLQPVTITEGATTNVAVQLARVVNTPGFIASDHHVHAINSPDSKVTNEERVATMLADGMDFFTPSDHDFRTDYEPTLVKMGVTDLISVAQSAEITTFDYGHFNSWPQPHDPSQLNGGGIDWGRAGIAPGMDFPSLGSYNLSPAEIYAAAHLTPGALIQINHMRSHFNTDGLDIDTAMTPPQSHTAAASRRLDPAVTNFFDSGFDALEVWIGTDGRSGDLEHFVGENLGDWFNMLNQGILRSGVADSDTHRRGTTQLNARTYIASNVTDPGMLGPEAANLAANVVAGKAIGTNVPFVTINATSTLGSAGLGVADSTMLPTNDGNVTITVNVKSPVWAEFDKIQFFINNAPQAYDHDGKPATRNRYRVIPNVEQIAGTDFTVNTVNDFPAIPGAQHLEATATLNLTGITGDEWVVVLVRGTDGVSHPLFPFLPNDIKKSTNTTLAQLVDGNLGEDGLLSLAFTNPIYIDGDDDGVWTPPGVMLTP